MSYLETGHFCGAAEYELYERSRLMPHDLYVDELYLIMLAVNSKNVSRQAAKKPARILENRSEAGLHVIKFAILDDDLRPEAKTGEIFDDGYWADAEGKVTIGPYKLPVTGGYFRDYGNGLGDELEHVAAGFGLGELVSQSAGH